MGRTLKAPEYESEIAEIAAILDRSLHAADAPAKIVWGTMAWRFKEMLMEIIRAHLRLANDAKPELEEIDADALVDTGALHLCIPEHVAMQLQLRTVETREVIFADGKPHQVPYVSPVRIELLGRHSVCGALVLGKEVLLGTIPMEDMDLIVEPARLKVSVNPQAPNIPMSVAMGNRNN